MKLFYFSILIILLSPTLTPQMTSLLYFPALEKKSFFTIKKKSTGALYFLNQEIISFFGKNTTRIINTDRYKNNCPEPSAFTFARDLLAEPDVFLNGDIYSQEKAKLSFKNTTKFQLLKLLIKFIIKTQENETVVDCIKDKSPSYKKIFFQLYYLEENIDKFDQLINKTLLRTFFEDLTKFSLARECSLPTNL